MKYLLYRRLAGWESKCAQATRSAEGQSAMTCWQMLRHRGGQFTSQL